MITEAPVYGKPPFGKFGLSPAKVLPADPQVYLLAARLISQRVQFYSCLAIRAAFKALYTPRGETDADLAEGSMFEAQYEAMFGPEEPLDVRWHPGLNKYQVVSYYDQDAYLRHPFWNQPDGFFGGMTPAEMVCVSESSWRKYSSYRIQALLFMAEIVGNP